MPTYVVIPYRNGVVKLDYLAVKYTRADVSVSRIGVGATVDDYVSTSESTCQL